MQTVYRQFIYLLIFLCKQYGNRAIFVTCTVQNYTEVTARAQIFFDWEKGSKETNSTGDIPDG